MAQIVTKGPAVDRSGRLFRYHGLPQHLDQMARRATRRMLDLLPARNAVRHNVHVRPGAFYRREQTLPTDVHRQLVMLRLVAERAGHATAPRGDLTHFVSWRQPQQRQRRRGADQRLLMTVAMQQQSFGRVGERQVQFVALVKLVEKFVDAEGVIRHQLGIRSGHQVEVIVT